MSADRSAAFNSHVLVRLAHLQTQWVELRGAGPFAARPARRLAPNARCAAARGRLRPSGADVGLSLRLLHVALIFATLARAGWWIRRDRGAPPGALGSGGGRRTLLMSPYLLAGTSGFIRSPAGRGLSTISGRPRGRTIWPPARESTTRCGAIASSTPPTRVTSPASWRWGSSFWRWSGPRTAATPDSVCASDRARLPRGLVRHVSAVLSGPASTDSPVPGGSRARAPGPVRAADGGRHRRIRYCRSGTPLDAPADLAGGGRDRVHARERRSAARAHRMGSVHRHPADLRCAGTRAERRRRRDAVPRTETVVHERHVHAELYAPLAPHAQRLQRVQAGVVRRGVRGSSRVPRRSVAHRAPCPRRDARGRPHAGVHCALRARSLRRHRALAVAPGHCRRRRHRYLQIAVTNEAVRSSSRSTTRNGPLARSSRACWPWTWGASSPRSSSPTTDRRTIRGGSSSPAPWYRRSARARLRESHQPWQGRRGPARPGRRDRRPAAHSGRRPRARPGRVRRAARATSGRHGPTWCTGPAS